MGVIGRLLDRRAPGADALPDPRRLGRRMTALYRHWQATGGPDLPCLAQQLLRRVGIAPDTPIAQTCRRAALAVTGWHGSAYHSARHHAEVATNAAMLGELSARLGWPIPAPDTALLLAAALAHDIHWEQAGARFAAEARSAAVLDAIAADCGVAEADRRAIHALVIATEPRSRACLAALLDGAAPARLPAALAPVAAEARLLRLASLLSDADLLCSAGLSGASTRLQWRRLERERGRPIEPGERRGFFDAIVGPDFLSPGGRYFSPNLTRIRRAPEVQEGQGLCPWTPPGAEPLDLIP